MPLGSDICDGCQMDAQSTPHSEGTIILTALQPAGAAAAHQAQRSPLLSISPSHVQQPWHARTAQHRAEQKVYEL